jgi:cyclophilin family peptidyl-prolyl cis-trans isomerase
MMSIVRTIDIFIFLGHLCLSQDINCDIILSVGKFIMICAIILLGLFTVLVINANISKPKLATENSLSNLSSISPSPTSTQILNITPSATATSSSQTENTSATIKTSKGDIKLIFYPKDAPNAVANFIKLAKQGFYDGVIFHRVIKGFMIQGGDPTGTGMGGPGYKFADELNPASPSYKAGYKKGVVAMANSGPNTNGSQFFIMLADYPLPNNYTIFGKVIKGQEVVDEIGNIQTDSGDRPTTPVKMDSITVAE